MKSKNKKKKTEETKQNFGFEEGYEDPKEANLKEAKRRLEDGILYTVFFYTLILLLFLCF